MAWPPLSDKRKSSPAAPDVRDEPADVQQARTRARRRLVGAAILLGIGVVAFPLLFETQPRPIPVDIPIEIPRKDAVAPLPAPKPMRPAPRVASEPPGDAVAAASAAPSAAYPRPAPAIASAPRARAPVAPAASAAPLPRAELPSTAPQAAAPAVTPAVTPAPAPSGASAADSKGARFVVQVGAFADAAAVREARAKVEKLGLKTYTQDVETSAGRRTRVRIGPFDSRDEAAQALAKLKAANLPGAVMAL
jgi:DedD protein